MTKAEACLPAGRDRNEVIIENPQAIRLKEADSLLYPQLTDIFFQAWHNEGLCENSDAAERKVYSFDPEEAFVVIDQTTGLALAMIDTLPIHAANIEDLYRQFPTYRSVEQASSNHFKANSPNFRICFSITALPGFRVLRGESLKPISLSQYLIKNLPQGKEVHQIAYSRYSRISPETSLVGHYLKNLDTPQTLGPVGMHEHLGGIAIAFIESSRREDKNGGGGNILVLYPNSPEEEARFDRIKKARATYKSAPTKTIGNLTLFLDFTL